MSVNDEVSLCLILQWIQEVRAQNDLCKPLMLFWAGKVICPWSPSYSDPSHAWTTPEGEDRVKAHMKGAGLHPILLSFL